MLGFVSLFIKTQVDNGAYAARVFETLPHEAVLASRRWHHLADIGGWGCSYAVVRLSADAPADPPLPTTGRAWYLRWGTSAWVATPDWAPCDTCRDAVQSCSARFDSDTAARLARALGKPGSWAQSDPVGDIVSIYSAPQAVAARIRLGD